MGWKDYLLVLMVALVTILYVELRTTSGELFRRDVAVAYQQLANRVMALETTAKSQRPQPQQSQ